MVRVRERGGLLAALPGREGMSDGVALPLTERERGAGPEGSPILALGRLGRDIAGLGVSGCKREGTRKKG